MKSHVKRHIGVPAVARPGVGEQRLQYVEQNIDNATASIIIIRIAQDAASMPKAFLKLRCTTRIWLQAYNTFLCILNKIYLETDEFNL